ncbi:MULTISPECIES: CmcI family methyltransferase [unclassified Prochlorococcus]|uniref:CmcI family methyltransferase n=1 Tax=unclassified Prochlorococcus TaxID=2627481 RepID=UPI0039A521B7
MTDLATIQELSAAGRHQECLQACQNALQANPEETYAYKYAGKSLFALGQLEKAHQGLLKAHQLDSSDPETVKDIANIYLRSGNSNDALQWYEKALELNNNYAPAINNIASLKRQSGNNQEAIDLFKRAIQADPNLVLAYTGVAASSLAINDLAQAQSFAEQALQINEKTPGVNEILGIVFQNKSNPDKAIEHYQREIGINPQSSNSLLNQGLILLQKDQPTAAIESLIKASAIAPSEQCSLLLAQTHQRLGQFKEAIIEYKKLNINQSKNKLIPFNLGLCLLEISDNSAAIEAFQIAIQLDETFIGAWRMLGSALKKEGLIEEACLATTEFLRLQSRGLKTTANISTIASSLGQKLIRQNLTPTFFDNAVITSLSGNKPWGELDIPKVYEELNESKENRFITFAERKIRTKGYRQPSALWVPASQGTHSLIKWKDYEIFKSSNDLIVYWMLFNEIKPDLIVEVGSGSGGSAIWMSDICKALELRTEIYSYDINKPEIEYQNVTFIEFDLTKLNCQNTRLPMIDNFKNKRKIVIEDAHVNITNVLKELDSCLGYGDYLVIEDSGIKQDELMEFVKSMREKYRVDQFYLDFFGVNTGCCIDSIFKIFPD